MQKDGYYIMILGPLDQLYLDTTSKEDLLAEINDQRRQVVEARGLAAELERKLWAVEKERDALLAVEAERNELRKKVKNLTDLNSYYRRLKKPEQRVFIQGELLTLIEKGERRKELLSRGYSIASVDRALWLYRKARKSSEEKAAQSI